MRNKMVRNVLPNHKCKNNMFHSQIGTRNKTVLNGQSGNNVLHLQIRTRNKTVLIYQFGNNLFHSQMGIRNRTVLNVQLWTNCSICRWELGTKQRRTFHLSQDTLLQFCDLPSRWKDHDIQANFHPLKIYATSFIQVSFNRPIISLMFVEHYYPVHCPIDVLFF